MTISALWVLMLLAGTVLFAPFRAPDEPQHVDLVRAVRQEQGYPRWDDRQLSRQVFDALPLVRFDQRSAHLDAADAPQRRDRPSFAEIGPDVGVEPNQLPSHPPLYYGSAAAAETLVATMAGGFADWPFDREVALLRLLGVVLLAPLPLLACLVARRLRLAEPLSIAAALVPLGIPQLVHIGASVTNDNMLTLLVGVATLLVVRTATGDRSWRTAVLLGVVAGLAMLTKAFALFLPVWIALAYARALAGLGSKWREGVGRGGLAIGLSLVVGGWWWLRNVLVFGTLQTGIKLLPAAPASFEPDPGWWAGRYLSFMVQRFWGWFGWFDVRIDPLVSAVATVAVLGCVLAALVSGRRRSLARLDVLLLLVPMGAIAAMVAIGAYQGYLRTGADEGLQGRYLFPGVVGLAAVVAAGLGVVGPKLVRLVPLVVGVAVVAMQAHALRTVVAFYWDDGDLGEGLRAAAAWSPWPGVVVAVGAVALLIAVALVGYELFDEARQPTARGRHFAVPKRIV